MLSLYDQQEEKDFFLLFLYIIGQSNHCRTLKKKNTHTNTTDKGIQIGSDE